jgi:membrane dipeptidase
MTQSYAGLVIDGHEDIAFNSLYLQEDFLIPSLQRRLDSKVDEKRLEPTVSLPDLIKGNVRIVFATIWTPPCLPGIEERPCYHSPKEAYALAMRQLEYYKSLVAAEHVVLIKDRETLRSVIETPSRVGLIILMEGADPVVSPKDVGGWYLDGLRILAPSWRATRYAGGTHMPGPLTEAGRELMRELNDSRLILDVSHMAEEAFFEALDRFQGTVIASHSNCRALVPTDRQLSDEMIRALVSRDAVIGVVLCNPFLLNGWKKAAGSKKSEVKLSNVIEHVQHICRIAGDSSHVAVGSDLDGGFGVESAPAEVDTVADLNKLGTALSDAGFSDKEVQQVMQKNWLRILERALPP